MMSRADVRAAELLSQRGRDLLAGGRPVEAVKAFRAAIASHEKYLDAHHGLVQALRDAGRLEQSIAAAMALTTLNPNDPDAHTELSLSLRRAGHIKEAEAVSACARVLEWSLELHMAPRRTWVN